MRYTVSFQTLAEALGLSRVYLWKRAKRAGMGKSGLTEKEVHILCELLGRTVPEKED